jgi:flagellin-like hook-associated protein FlgL
MNDKSPLLELAAVRLDRAKDCLKDAEYFLQCTEAYLSSINKKLE